ncbi:MAG: hypothetical protein DRN57_01000 [Thermoplasmata archaeon]|nr:MAG: hypothetical protein DRN57_01000 [Thermoplasmata archaeon]
MYGSIFINLSLDIARQGPFRGLTNRAGAISYIYVVLLYLVVQWDGIIRFEMGPQLPVKDA